jgi:octaprenyl-diphosphate synthase
LTGDNLFTRSVLLLLENKDYEILKILSNSIEKVIEGELLQMDKSRKLNLNEEVYFEIIKSKTAALLASTCGAGGLSTTFNDKKSIDVLYQFGLYAGITFQIKDDLF